MLPNTKVTAFTVPELLRENQQEVKLPPPPPRLIWKCRLKCRLFTLYNAQQEQVTAKAAKLSSKNSIASIF